MGAGRPFGQATAVGQLQGQGADTGGDGGLVRHPQSAETGGGLGAVIGHITRKAVM